MSEGGTFDYGRKIQTETLPRWPSRRLGAGAFKERP